MKKFIFIFFISIAIISIITSSAQKAYAAVLFSDPMTSDIDATHWTVFSQNYNVTSSGIQDNGSGNWTNLASSSNINFQNDNLIQVTAQLSSQVSYTTLECRTVLTSSGDLIEVSYNPDGTGSITLRYHDISNNFNFTWNNTPGTHILAASCRGTNVTAYEDGATLLSQTLPTTIQGTNYNLGFAGGNNIYSNFEYCDNAGCSSSNHSPVISSIANVTLNQGDTYTTSGSFSDPDSTSWTATVDYGDGSGAQPLSLSGYNFTLNHTYSTAGTYTMTVSVTDNQGATGTGIAIVTVNAPPAVLFSDMMTSDIDATHWTVFSNNYNVTSSGIQDDGSGNWTNLASNAITYQNDNLIQVTAQLSSQVSYTTLQCRTVLTSSGDLIQVSYNPDGTGAITLRDTAEQNNYNFTWNNTPGTHILAASCRGANVKVYEDGATLLSQTLPTTIEGTNYNLGFAGGNNIYSNFKYCNSAGCTQPPTVGAITVSPNPVQINTATSASASFTESGYTGSHTASWNWGYGNTTTGTVTESNGSGSVSDNHTYTTAGVYTITLTVTDSNGAQGTQTFQYVSVYNPTTQGLFTAGQHFSSPAGAYPANSSLTGTVKFGLSYKYQGTMPTGVRQFTMDFKAANLLFNATSISSLVISNNMATLTGTGTITGRSGTFNFLVTGVDGGDIRIQITDSSNNVIYDTQPGDPATATPTTTVTGNVIAHN